MDFVKGAVSVMFWNFNETSPLCEKMYRILYDVGNLKWHILKPTWKIPHSKIECARKSSWHDLTEGSFNMWFLKEPCLWVFKKKFVKDVNIFKWFHIIYKNNSLGQRSPTFFAPWISLITIFSRTGTDTSVYR